MPDIADKRIVYTWGGNCGLATVVFQTRGDSPGTATPVRYPEATPQPRPQLISETDPEKRLAYLIRRTWEEAKRAEGEGKAEWARLHRQSARSLARFLAKLRASRRYF